LTLLAAQAGEVAHDALVGRADLLDEAAGGQQVAALEQFDDFVEQRLHLQQHQGVELVEQVVDDRRRRRRGSPRRSRPPRPACAGRGRGGGEGTDAGDRLHLDLRRQFAHDAGEVAEGGEGRGVALDQEHQVAAFGEQLDGASRRGPRPCRESRGRASSGRPAPRRRRHGEAAALDDRQRVRDSSAFFTGYSQRAPDCSAAQARRVISSGSPGPSEAPISLP
jgi:hypothetical protein